MSDAIDPIDAYYHRQLRGCAPSDKIESLEAQLTVAMRERNDAIQASMNDMSQLAEAVRKEQASGRLLNIAMSLIDDARNYLKQ